ncbi:hypothetical protein GQ55_6G281800 [Panicum hallii var. hallii]|uniref:Uncharacterized protein n=1 Tax=Panicum hallii var. hallii TaxID=1504633 RepID=A0A2T7DAH0_9POAL|nr:hypothetical protein GQ55_6G281800 [Panicum hallii var. hallii]
MARRAAWSKHPTKPKISRRHQKEKDLRGAKRSGGAGGERKDAQVPVQGGGGILPAGPAEGRGGGAPGAVQRPQGQGLQRSNQACSVELRRLPTPPASADPKPQPPRVLVTYLNGAEEAIVAAEGATAHGIRDQILARGRLIDTEQMFRDGEEKWPVVIPEEELGMSFPGIKEIV